MLASLLVLPSLLAAKFEPMLGLEDLGLVAVSLVPFRNSIGMASFPTCAWVRGLLDLVEVCAEDGGR